MAPFVNGELVAHYEEFHFYLEIDDALNVQLPVPLDIQRDACPRLGASVKVTLNGEVSDAQFEGRELRLEDGIICTGGCPPCRAPSASFFGTLDQEMQHVVRFEDLDAVFEIVFSLPAAVDRCTGVARVVLQTAIYDLGDERIGLPQSSDVAVDCP